MINNTITLLLLLICSYGIIQETNSDMVFEMKLQEFQNPTNRTYANRLCSKRADCNIGFLFCLIELPFRNPQNCTLGDYTTPILGGNNIMFPNYTNEYTYYFIIRPRTSHGIGMMIEVRDYSTNETWEPVDFYTSALADIPLTRSNSRIIHPIKKRFSSLFNHNSTLTVQSRLYCAKNYYGQNCETYCDDSEELSYTCDPETGKKKCRSGLIGELCNIPHICTTFPCFHNGTCISPNGINYTCICPKEYTGNNCESEINYFNPCQLEPCYNGGTCRVKNNGFECQCPNEFYGTYCELALTQNLIVETKVQTKPIIENSKSFTASTYEIHQKSMIEVTKVMNTSTSTKSCDTHNPCLHGTCYFNNVTDEISCQCDMGYMGPFCDLITHPCDFKPCENGGTCETVGQFNYKCLCNTNYTGMNCETEIKRCTNDICKNGGSCIVNEDNKLSCKCPSDYDGQYCENLKNPCNSNPCLNDGLCSPKHVNGIQTVECSCKYPYTGEFCETKTKTCNDTECLNGGRCVQVSELITECQCEQGFYGHKCENDVDECSLIRPCKNDAECTNTFGSFECLCPKYFYGKTCEQRIDPCLSSPCQNNGTCLFDEKNDIASCSCPQYFTGNYCEISLDICDIENVCLNNGTCIADPKFPNLFTCQCEDGYTGETCDTRIHICDRTNPCLNGGECLRYSTIENISIDSEDYSCSCPNGYNGKRCENEIDVCESNPCLNNGICTRKSATEFKCECPDGYNGITCENDVDACKFQLCKNNATCIDEIGNNFNCICTIGYRGKLCEIDINECESQPCLNGGTCIEMEPGNFRCNCLTSFSGSFCEKEIKIDKCENYCYNNGTCNLINSTIPKCTCPKRYSGKRCENKLTINPCAIKKCLNGGFCKLSQNSNAICICKSGFTGELCESIRKCKNSDLCQNNGTCIALNSTYEYCSCAPSYTGSNCETMVKLSNSYNSDANRTIEEISSTTIVNMYIPATAPPSSFKGRNSNVWIIVIIFGYIFGLLILFVVIWFLWYGISLCQIDTENPLNTTNSLSACDYAMNMNLNKQIDVTHENVAFNGQDESFIVTNETYNETIDKTPATIANINFINLNEKNLLNVEKNHV